MSSGNSSSINSPLLSAILAFNLAINFVQISLSFLNILSLFRTSLIHPHLKAVLFTQSVSFCINSLGCSFFIVIHSTFLAKFFCFLGINLCNFIGHVLIIERIIATWKADKYEKWRSPQFIITLLLTMGLISTFFITIEFLEGPNVLFITFITSFINSFLCFSEIFIFANINIYCQKRCKQSMDNAEHGQDKLSERYQLNENVRTARQLAPVFLFHFLIVFATLPILFVQYFQLTKATQLLEMLIYAYEFFTTILCSLIEFALLVRYKLLRKNAVQLLQIVRSKVTGRNQIGNVEMKENCEERHEKAAQFEMERHFNMLTNAWA